MFGGSDMFVLWKKEERGELKRIWYNGSYNRDFKDLNDVHLAEAKRIGIQPASNREEAEKVKGDGGDRN